jgi:ABC-type Fe3+-siderophore transport system permease subunit
MSKDLMISPQLLNIILFFFGFLGSIIVGIITYFLTTLIKELKLSDKEINIRMVMIELELVRIRKDIEHLNEYYEKAGS